MIYYYECVEIPRFRSMFTVIRDTRWSIANNEHKFFYIEDGACQIRVNNKDFTLTKDDIFYIPKNVPYVRSPLNNEPCEIFSLCFDLTPVKKEILDYKNINVFLLNHDYSSAPLFDNKLYFLLPDKLEIHSNKIIKKMLKLKSFIDIKRPFNQQIISFALCSLITDISAECYSSIIKKPEAIVTTDYPKPLYQSIEYIKKNYNKSISLEELCNASFVSKQMLIKYFNRYTGKSPLNYITDYKVNLIKSLLISSNNVNIKEICTMFGFEDQCYFSRVFKKHTGMSPKEYKKYVSEKKDIIKTARNKGGS